MQSLIDVLSRSSSEPSQDQYTDALLERLSNFGVETLEEALGQNFLTDPQAIKDFISAIPTGSDVIEIGAGDGHLSAEIARRIAPNSLTALEIDPRMRPLLEDLEGSFNNVRYVIGDALRFPFPRITNRSGKPREKRRRGQTAKRADAENRRVYEELYDDEFEMAEQQIYQEPSSESEFKNGAILVGSLPFHLTEGLFVRLPYLDFDEVVLMLGRKAIEEISSKPSTLRYGRLSLIAQTYYEIEHIRSVPKEAFYPIPPTDAGIVRFRRREQSELRNNPLANILSRMITSPNGTIGGAVTSAMVDANAKSTSTSGRHRHKSIRADTRAQLRAMRQQYRSGSYNPIETGMQQQPVAGRHRNAILSQGDAENVLNRYGVGSAILSKPFHALNNQDLQKLVTALTALYGE